MEGDRASPLLEFFGSKGAHFPGQVGAPRQQGEGGEAHPVSSVPPATRPHAATIPAPTPEGVCPHSASSCITGFWTLVFAQQSQGRGKGEGMRRRETD